MALKRDICDTKCCTGCGLCTVICPKGCIELVPKLLGHVYPRVSQENCIDCGLCNRCCPQNNEVTLNLPLRALAGWSRDVEEYRTSTSGGAAAMLSNYILSQNGVVYGCAMLPSVNIEHIRVTSNEELKKLKGSKYVHSSIVSALRSIKRDIANGRKVLFVGTPCQVAAVHRLYKSVPENLLLVDLICHGIPSQKLLQWHIEKTCGTIEVSDVKFRTVKGFEIVVYNQDKVCYENLIWGENRKRDFYYETFLSGYTYRDSCYRCKYACSERCSDLTIGDFWGIDKRADSQMPNHPNGLSLILPVTNKGEKIIAAVSDDMFLFERPLEEAIAGNCQLQYPTQFTGRIKAFRMLSKLMSPLKAYSLVMLDIKVRQLLKKMSL